MLLRWKPQCNATPLFAFPWPFRVQRNASPTLRDQGSSLISPSKWALSESGSDWGSDCVKRCSASILTEINESASVCPLVLNCSIGSNSPSWLSASSLPSCWFKAVLAWIGAFLIPLFARDMIFDHATSNVRAARDTKCQRRFFSSSRLLKLSTKNVQIHHHLANLAPYAFHTRSRTDCYD